MLWVAFDTPVDEEDRVDVDFVVDHVREVLPRLDRGTLSSPPRSCRSAPSPGSKPSPRGPGASDLEFAAVPENLRLGKALDSFRKAERFVAGVRDRGRPRRAGAAARTVLRDDRVDGGRVGGDDQARAERLPRHLGRLHQRDRDDLRGGRRRRRRGLARPEERRANRPALLPRPGDAFAGGTLARDITTLRRIAGENDLPANLVGGVADSNDAHRQWARRVLSDFTAADGGLAGKRVGVWGLAYKPGTDTLRRSSSLELCRWLRAEGAEVSAHDPAVAALPEADLALGIEMAASALDAATDADALVISTAWPEYREPGAARDPRRDARHLGRRRGGFPRRHRRHRSGRRPTYEWGRGRDDRGEFDGALDGKAALITGANQGLGLEIARHYLDAGAQVFICARNAELLESARRGAGRARRRRRPRGRDGRRRRRPGPGRGVGRGGDRALPAALDPGQQRRRLRAEGADRDGRLGGVDAGDRGQRLRFDPSRPGADPAPARARWRQDRSALRRGRHLAAPGLSSYAASKAAIVRFAETLALELAEDEIDVNAVAPGALNTRLLDEVLEAGPDAVGEDFYRRSLEQQKSGGTPLELGAELAVWLGSGASDGITGRLLSAKWDPWRDLPEHRADLDSDVYTLRRIVPADRGLDWGDV